MEKKYSKFLEEGIWQNGWEDKFQKVVDSAEVGDIIFLKSTFRTKKEGGFLKLSAIGVILENEKGNGLLKVNWFEFEDQIELKRGAHLRNAIQKIGDQYINDILSAVLVQYPDLLNIVESLSEIKEPENPNILDIIQTKIDQKKHFWWLNDIEHDWFEDEVVDTTLTYSFSFRDALNPKKGELFIVSVEPILDDKLVDNLYSEIKNFFDLPVETKEKYEIPGIGGQRGYVSFGKESAKGKKEGDLKEFWHFGQYVSKDSKYDNE